MSDAPASPTLVIYFTPPRTCGYRDMPPVPIPRLTAALSLCRDRLLGAMKSTSWRQEPCAEPAELHFVYDPRTGEVKERWFGDIPHDLVCNGILLILADLIDAQREVMFQRAAQAQAGRVEIARGPLH